MIDAIQEAMEQWDAIVARIREAHPMATEAEIQELASATMNHSLEQP